MPVDWADLQALELYQQVERLGWDLVLQLRTLRLTAREAEALFLRLEWLHEHLPVLRQQFYGQREG